MPAGSASFRRTERRTCSASSSLLRRIEREDVDVDPSRLRDCVENGGRDVLAFELLDIAQSLCDRRADIGAHLRHELGFDGAGFDAGHANAVLADLAP